MASFWRRTFGLGGNSEAFPSGSGPADSNIEPNEMNHNQNESEMDENDEASDAAAMLPPPPTTNTYIHHSAETLPGTPGRTRPATVSAGYETAGDVPEFHIFQQSVDASSGPVAVQNQIIPEEQLDTVEAAHEHHGDNNDQRIQEHNRPITLEPPSSPSLLQVETVLPHQDESLVDTTETSLVLVDEHPEMALSHLDSRFDFLKHAVPLQSLQDRATQRRHESKQRIHALACQLASLQARLAQASMDRDVAFKHVLETNLYHPLSSIRVTTSSQLVEREQSLARRLRELESRMVQHAHMTIPRLLHEELDSQQASVVTEWEPMVRLESSKVDKREGTLVRRFESFAGTMSRQHAEEVAVRKAQLMLLRTEWENPQEQKRCMEFQDKLHQLRVKLERERDLRLEQDKRVQDMIAKRTGALKRAFLEAVGTS